MDWTETDSQDFIEYGRYIVPQREIQIKTICNLIPHRDEPFQVLELCCGEGLLAEAILDHFPNCTVFGYDGSVAMLDKASQRLTRFGPRFQTMQFDLAAQVWRQTPQKFQAIVSSLAIHHLDGTQKQGLFGNMWQILSPGGALLIADLIQPTSKLATQLAAEAWDTAVYQQSLDHAGNTAAYDYFVSEKWNIFRYPDPMDKTSPLPAQLNWLADAGYTAVDVFWLAAGHAVYGGYKPLAQSTSQ